MPRGIRSGCCRSPVEHGGVRTAMTAPKSAGGSRHAHPGDRPRCSSTPQGALVHAGVRGAAVRCDRAAHAAGIDTDAEVYPSVFDIYAQTEMTPGSPSSLIPAGTHGRERRRCNPRLNRQLPRRCRHRARDSAEFATCHPLEAPTRCGAPWLEFYRRRADVTQYAIASPMAGARRIGFSDRAGT